MSWHEQLQQLPSKGVITAVTGTTSVTGMVANFAADLQPMVNLAVGIVGILSGLTAIIVGSYAIKERRQSIIYNYKKSQQDTELHEVIMQKQQLEVFNLKRELNEKN